MVYSEQIGSISHEHGSDGAVETRGPSGFVIECVKDGKCRLVEAHGEPSDRAGLGQDDSACALEKFRHMFFLAWLCFQFNVECETGHKRTLLSLCFSANIYPREGEYSGG
jgi:hypothetical protein